MPDVVTFDVNTGKVTNYIQSANMGEYVVDPNVPKTQVTLKPGVLFNPSLPNVDRKYWKVTNNVLGEMTAQEKAAVDLAELNSRKSAADTFMANPIAIFTALIKVINLRLPSGQKITKQELIDAVKAEVT